MVLLVSAYELGHQPIALANAAAHLGAAGVPVECADLAVAKLDPAQVARAELVAISVPMHTALRLGVRAAKRVREIAPKAGIVFFGLYATLNERYLLDEGIADAVVAGDGAPALAGFLRAGARSIPGVRTRGDSTPLPPEALHPVLPRRSGLPALGQYARAIVDGEERLAGAVQASIGCKHMCTHCPIPPVFQSSFFSIDPAIVLADIDALVRAGARHITFADPDFWNSPKAALAVAEGLHRAHPDLTFDATIKVEHLLRRAELLPAMRAAGCVFVVSAVESLSDRVLAILEKRHTAEDVDRAIEKVTAAGISFRPSLLPFTPWSTLEDFFALLDFAERDDLAGCLDPVQLSIRLLVPPGSLLENHVEMRPHRIELDREAFSWRWRHPDPRMDSLQKRVAAIAAEGATAGEDARAVIAKMRAAALEAAGRSEKAAPRLLSTLPRANPPRLTEPWFC